jgi:hypothetical protein
MNLSEPEYDDDQPLLTPPLLLRSFLNVASGYAIYYISLLGVGVGMAAAFFPATFEAITGDPDILSARLAEDPSSIAPAGLLAAVIITQTILCVGIGWLVARLAPIAPYHHGGILAAIIFFGHFQQAIGGLDSMRGVSVALMILMPLAIVYGSRRYRAGDSNADEGGLNR